MSALDSLLAPVPHHSCPNQVPTMPRRSRRWIVGGDVVLFGAWPAEMYARMRELADAAWLRGNTDRWLRDDSDRPPVASAAAEACRGALSENTVDELAGLPFDAREGDALYVHASALNDMRSFFPE